MKTVAMLVLDTPDLPAETLAVLTRALGRRGWSLLSGHVFRREFNRKQCDKQIVQQAEHDLKEAEYVAGAHGLEAVCLIGDLDELMYMVREGSRG